MKKIISIICFSLVLASVCFGTERLSNYGKRGLYATTVEQMLALSEDEIDLGTAALIISENWSENVYGRRYREELDRMAQEILTRMNEQRIPANYRAIDIINDYLFKELKFQSVSKADNPDDLFLHSVMDNKQGYCLSLSMLYLAIGERLGLPLYGVVVPGHFFVRYDDGRKRFNIETTCGGAIADDKHYIEKFDVPKGESVYMKKLTKRQSMGCFLNNLGNSYNDVGNIKQAALSLETAIEINPSLAEARINLGNIYLAHGQVDDAIAEYRTAIDINPNNAKSHNNLGNAYSQKRNVSLAIDEYNTSMNLDPEFVDVYKNIAIVYTQQKLYYKALTNLRQALELEPRDAETHAQMANVYYELGQTKNAITEFSEALRLNPQAAEAYFGLAICYNKEGSSRKEISAYKKALSIKPDMTEAMINLGSVYFDQKDYDSAIKQYKAALRVSPKSGMIYYNLAAAYSNSGEFDEAENAYDQALKIDPQMANAHNGIAFVLYKLEKYKDAQEHLIKAKELGANVSSDLEKALEQKLK